MYSPTANANSCIRSGPYSWTRSSSRLMYTVPSSAVLMESPDESTLVSLHTPQTIPRSTSLFSYSPESINTQTEEYSSLRFAILALVCALVVRSRRPRSISWVLRGMKHAAPRRRVTAPTWGLKRRWTLHAMRYTSLERVSRVWSWKLFYLRSLLCQLW